MKAISFRAANDLIHRNPNAIYSDSIKEIQPIPIYTNGEVCISKWKLSFMDKIRVLISGYVWVATLDDGRQPPIELSTCKDYIVIEEIKNI